jgi:hypothetical protein
MGRWDKIAGWLEAYGFALLVLLEILAAAAIALTASVSENPPLVGDSEPLYRLLVGAAALIAFYLAGLAFVLALRGFGFTQLGPRGVKASRVLNEKQGRVLLGQEEGMEGLKSQSKLSISLTAAIAGELQQLREEVGELRQSRELDSESEDDG